MEYALTIAVAFGLVALVRYTFDDDNYGRLLPFLLFGFFLRLVVHVAVLRSGILQYGGDNYTYEWLGQMIASSWRLNGFEFITDGEFAALRTAAVPCHLFAIMSYLADGPAPLACTAVVAFIAVGLCIVIFHFARLIGADAASSRRLVLINLFSPNFLLHTSDTFKDGINAFLVVFCLYLAVRLSRRFSMPDILLIAPALFLLWYVRPYMVFLCALPLALGIVGLKRALSLRAIPVLAIITIGGVVVLTAQPESLGQPLEAMEGQYDRGTSEAIRADNASGASGVTFDDGGSAWGAIGPKLVYTLLAPFPWQGGSVALQLGKIETLLWYWLLFVGLKGMRWYWRNDRDTLMLLLLFLVPTTLAYASTMANVGLMFRQRMPIVCVFSLLTAVIWTRDRRATATDRVAPAAALPS